MMAHGSAKFIALTARPHAAEGLGLLRAGVRGYAKPAGRKQGGQAIVDAVLADEVWAGREVTERLLQQALSTPAVQVAEANGCWLNSRRVKPRLPLPWPPATATKVIALDSGVSERDQGAT